MVVAAAANVSLHTPFCFTRLNTGEGVTGVAGASDAPSRSKLPVGASFGVGSHMLARRLRWRLRPWSCTCGGLKCRFVRVLATGYVLKSKECGFQGGQSERMMGAQQVNLQGATPAPPPSLKTVHASPVLPLVSGVAFLGGPAVGQLNYSVHGKKAWCRTAAL